MEPTTLLLAASSAFAAVKKGMQYAKDVESMAGDIGRWLDAVNSLEEHHKKEKRRYGSVETEALESWAAIRKAKAQEEELRLYIIAHHGMDAWQQILRIQGRIRKQRQLEAERKQKQRETVIQWSVVAGIITGGFLLIVAILRQIFP